MRLVCVLLSCLIFGTVARGAETSRPNVIFMLADDVGYGDLSCYGATKLKTPALDQLAREGVRFTDAHASASVCTPTRYSLLTGQYAFRNPAGSHILSGVDPLSIKPGSATLPRLFQDAGYVTGIVGKWRLGLGDREGAQDWNGEIKPGPLEVGFSYSFIIPATGDRVPCVFIENHRVVGLDPKDPMAVGYGKRIGHEPTGADPQGATIKLPAKGSHNQSLVNGIGRIGFMTGGQKARWVDEETPSVLTGKAVAFLEAHQREPFFLYFASHDIHAPRVANSRFKGSSQCGIRGDVVQQLDWQAGEILKALDRLGLAKNTLIIFSSDNGGTLQNGYDEGTAGELNGHAINGALRGYKGSLWEGGTRVPFIARWPGHIKPGTTSSALISSVDMCATMAALTGKPLPADAAPDSFNVLSAFLGEKLQQPVRDHLLLQGNGTSGLALRQGLWKYIPRSGGGKKKGAGGAELYNLETDLAENNNLAAANPEKVQQLNALLKSLRERPQTRP